MKYILRLFIALLPLSVCGQPDGLPNRKPVIEPFAERVYTAEEFQRVADSLHITTSELSDYPVIFPVRKPVVSSGFGMRKHPVYKMRKFHTGVDFAHLTGTPVYATGNGIVIRKGYSSGYGNFIEIEHAGGFRSFYAHLSKALVNTGDSVIAATQIACVGNSGVATGSHLHYEVRKGKRFLNPIRWCYCLSKVIK